MTYQDAENMSVYQRKTQFKILLDDIEKQKKDAEKNQTITKKWGR